jgi:molybdopterin/thiamine biosynthesis adenylyltransferase
MKIKVIGIGGIGDALLLTLIRYLYFQKPSARITLIDGDNYEEKNRERQSFDRIGNKAEIKAERLRLDFSQLSIKAEPEYITPESAEYLIEDGDIVFLCVDNHKTRSFVSEFCRDVDNITLISGGNDYTDGNIQVYVRRNGEDLTLPLGNKYHPEIAFPQGRSPHEIGCGEVVESNPQLVITNNFIAALMLNAFYACSQGKFQYDEVYGDILTNNCRAVNRR